MPTDESLQITQARDSNTYYVGNDTWNVGPRYKLQEHLGSGSFSRVCAAIDTKNGNKMVALKKVSGVGRNFEHARIVLRELCIMRRLKHPHTLNLHDAFWKPSPLGPFKLVKGELQSSTLDVYFAMEFCTGGDLLKLKGHLTPPLIQRLMYQLLTAVRYMHELSVWHRDLKSANVLLTLQSGEQVVKVGDFGSARSGATILAGSSAEEADMAEEVHAGVSMVPQRKLEQPKEAGMYTTRVCTPCYRAPEVVLARGRYNSAMDMWSVGCIFGELLQRMERAGTSFTPNLTINPVFQLSDSSPITPQPDCKFMEDRSLAHRELKAIFDVVGTPEWACIEAVENERWRCYLRQLPAKAPHLMRRFGMAGEAAVDLLRRLLAFDPKRRCTAVEALSHEYFASMNTPSRSTTPTQQWKDVTVQERCRDASKDASMELAEPVRAASASPAGPCGVEASGQLRLEPLKRYSGRISMLLGMGRAASAPIDVVVDSTPAEREPDQDGPQDSGSSSLQYSDIVEPAEALRVLEIQLESVVREAARGDHPKAHNPCDFVCSLIKQECQAEMVRHETLSQQRSAADGAVSSFQSKWWGRASPLEPDPRLTVSNSSTDPVDTRRSDYMTSPRTGGTTRDALWSTSSKMRWPAAASEDQDTALEGKDSGDVSAEVQLKPGRHHEWSLQTGSLFTAPEGPVWGGGLHTLTVDDAMHEVISNQQKR